MNHEKISTEINRYLEDAKLLSSLIQPLKSQVRTIRQSTSPCHLFAVDGGNNKVLPEPFQFQALKIADSTGAVSYKDLLSPATQPSDLMDDLFDGTGRPRNDLAQMMRALDVDTLWELSPMLPKPGEKTPPEKWIGVYRELAEWAALYRLAQNSFTADTIIVRDGFLRTKVFSKELFSKYQSLLEQAIKQTLEENESRLYFVGIAKRSGVVTQFSPAIYAEEIFNQDTPCYVQIPRELEKYVYKWDEYALDETHFVAGTLFVVRFGG